ncbi:MAG: Dipeptide transport system permease protein DppB, partial [uncultured Corynebacteriales bacterium]
AALRRQASAAADPDPVRVVHPAVRVVASPPGRAGSGPPGGARHAGAGGGDQPDVRSGPAALRAVLALSPAGRPVRLRRLHPDRPAGHPGDHRPVPGHHRAHHRGVDLRGRRRHPAGLLRGPAAGHHPGQPGRGGLAGRRDHPGVLPGVPAEVLLRGRAGLAAAVRPAGRPDRRHSHHQLLRPRRVADPRVRRGVRRGETPDPAGHRARHDPTGDHRADHPGRGPGRGERGLRAYGRGQGPDHLGDPAPARAAQRDAAGRHHDRPAVGPAAVRGDPHRAGVRLPRHRLGDRQRDHEQGLRHPAGRDPAGRGAVRADQPGRRPAVRRPRPEGEGPM